MINKKISFLVLASLFLFLSLSFISASLQITKEIVSPIAVWDISLPAIFKLSITNLGSSDDFTIYSLAGIDILPAEPISILNGETKEVTIQVSPKIPLKVSPDYLSFEYNIKGANSAIQSDSLPITYVNLKDAFDFSVEDIAPNSTVAKVHIDNKAGSPIENIKLDLSSLFFSDSRELSFQGFEKKVLEVQINQDKMHELFAGSYMLSGKLKIQGVQALLNAVINFNEQEGIKTFESSEGKILQKYEIKKSNEGNTRANVNIVIKKNLISALFTSFNLKPTRKELNTFSINYVFRENLSPGQNLDVVATTNWWILIILIVVIIIIYKLIDRYLKNKIVLKKRVSLVRTKGGEFALKVSIHIRARDFVEKLRVYDRLPPMVKVFEKYGSLNPDKIDSVNRRLEWNIQALGKGEERTLSYIVYSKIGVLGKFELPAVELVYEYNGRIKEASSNRAFFVNEPRVKKD